MADESFIDKCVAGTAKPEELNDYIEYWHEHSLGISLQKFLGLTKAEYETWLKGTDAVILNVIADRKAGR